MIIAFIFIYSVMRFAPSTLSLAIFSSLSAHLFAETNSTQDHSVQDDLIKFSTIVVQAKIAPEIGKSAYDEDDLKQTPNSSKSITDFLKVNPNVQFSNNQLAANTQADLKPSEISIHGAQSFQNNFIINGVSNSNILDPAGSGSNAGEYGITSSGSQGVAINTDLLCNLEVLDSNVSAKYGSFTGGVISADTCAPKSEIGKVHGTVSYDYTSSDWVKYHQETDADKGLYEGESTQGNQKEYTRQGLSANVYTKLSEIYGLNVFASQRQSDIPVQTGMISPNKVNQKKLNTNIGATLFANPNQNTAIKAGFNLGDLESNSFFEKKRNSHSQLTNDSLLVFAELDKKYDWGQLKQRLNYQQIDNLRTNEATHAITWLHSEGSKDWTNTKKVSEGPSSANIDLAQQNFSYNLDSNFSPFQLLNTKHQINAGLGYQRDDVKWERTKDFFTFYGLELGKNQALFDLEGQQCQQGDYACDESPTSALSTYNFNGQYFKKGNLFKAGQFSGTYSQINAYIEDEIQWKNVKARIGLRADYDESNSNLNFAPRTNFTYQPFNNELLKLTTGWSRYYSAPTYITDLHGTITKYDFTLSRDDQNSAWKEPQKYSVTSTRKSDLKTPYADELVLGISGIYKNASMALKWVNRDYKDEITRERTSIPSAGGFNRSFEFGNSGYAKNDTITFEINSIDPIQLYSSNHHLGFGINYSDIYRGTPDYTTDYNEVDMEEFVSYNGEIIHYADRPASNYNQPITARVMWDIGFDHTPLKITNFFSYKDSYDQVLSSAQKVVHDGKKLDTYVLDSVKPRFSWDIRTSYDWKITKDYSAIFGLTINNLTDRNNLYVNGSKLYSEVGRQFVADVTFKF